MPHARSEVISAKYMVQYIFAAAAMAAVEPVIGAIGVGWTFTICEYPRWDYDRNISNHPFRCILCYSKWFHCACYHEMGHWHAAMVWKEVQPRSEELTTTIWRFSPFAFMSLHLGRYETSTWLSWFIDGDRHDDFVKYNKYRTWYQSLTIETPKGNI